MAIAAIALVMDSIAEPDTVIRCLLIDVLYRGARDPASHLATRRFARLRLRRRDATRRDAEG